MQDRRGVLRVQERHGRRDAAEHRRLRRLGAEQLLGRLVEHAPQRAERGELGQQAQARGVVNHDASQLYHVGVPVGLQYRVEYEEYASRRSGRG